jgi:hypothetical protein
MVRHTAFQRNWLLSDKIAAYGIPVTLNGCPS